MGRLLEETEFKEPHTMAIEIKAPTFPESVADGTVATWHKKPGDAVKRDELIVDIETDKVVIEVLAEADGVLAADRQERRRYRTQQRSAGYFGRRQRRSCCAGRRACECYCGSEPLRLKPRVMTPSCRLLRARLPKKTVSTRTALPALARAVVSPRKTWLRPLKPRKTRRGCSSS